MKRLGQTIIFVFAICGCSDSNPGPKSITIQTPDGAVTADQTQVENYPQQIKKLTADEVAPLLAHAARANEFLAAYAPTQSEPDLKDFDVAFRNWQTSQSPAHSQDEVVQILGAYLGKKCVETLPMEWVSVTDEYGTDYAVRGTTQELMAFPFSTVQKRIDDKEHDFIHGVYHTIKHQMESGEMKQISPSQ
jgi:hypothetical protein